MFLDIFSNIIQVMHYFEVNSMICQPENSDVHRGEALLYDTVSLFSVLFKVFSYLLIYSSQMFLVH